MFHRTASSLVIVGSFLMLAGCTDKAEPDYTRCLDLETKGETQNARDACNAAVTADPNSKSGKAAAAKVTELQAKLDVKLKAEQAQAEAAKRAAFEKAGGWRGMPTKLNQRIRTQAASDLTSGGATPVLDVITSEMGQPAGTFPDSVSVWYVWGAQLGSSASKDDIKGAPFSVRTRSGLTCGDYAPNMVEFWVSGERAWP
jgi:hypothetical protein